MSWQHARGTETHMYVPPECFSKHWEFLPLAECLGMPTATCTGSISSRGSYCQECQTGHHSSLQLPRWSRGVKAAGRTEQPSPREGAGWPLCPRRPKVALNAAFLKLLLPKPTDFRGVVGLNPTDLAGLSPTQSWVWMRYCLPATQPAIRTDCT